ncbi:MAG: hypothetical protein A3C93_06045 [Candidatus Lloydbacteria bacterium RIFCSPHIGHO2_02_FULL_54_17]|uniref:Uncharacterized protein n=1 Tax=Candidatus Lloydbacteria bacterium RIFCSPHIGHO2_02_FULL_54_17 TaxID=1798664 RepID=A0A1G2DGU5_9BACT|nr:MAG: hypothetical protein A2762_00780 [Candidatus Lloydbacteria bacterium RIFCSPHIGHO2_01_FULL_54_11]OGZ12642.1 MAG: hypothetical protein A3C93_06045 [Candidatus Lloydbacteria bacterium RIFCSPHIGHO2_02_FULL_54_17]OGZ13494.1 MAG: hypothetical protein A2948_04710 [Candidatus Lloydbacteria bacterium RIFCSPLOWO2_01_FULL_54_18]OGZ14688.1 MAG: hypothetical protein A3H76_00930 [Candidatus Lloydbacteria bacterium RIFCSPLOWO2_02_FULL_54_12]
MTKETRNTEPTLQELEEQEEICRKATAEAERDLEEGRTTEAVFEDLRTRYFLAKQAVRDFRADVQ